MALFAALSWAITQSGRGGGTITEQDTIYAAQIVQAGADLKAGVQMMILNGTASTSIVTNTPLTAGYVGIGSLNGGANPCTTGVNCLFAPEGGGVTLPQVPRNAFLPNQSPTYIGYGWTSYFAGAGSFTGFFIDGLAAAAWGTPDMAFSGVGTAAKDDVVLFLPLTKSVCIAINKGLGFSGIHTGGDVTGLESACIDKNGNGDPYMYYQVLVAN